MKIRTETLDRGKLHCDNCGKRCKSTYYSIDSEEWEMYYFCSKKCVEEKLKECKK